MSAKKDERTLKMMDNFVSLHDDGYAIAEIAEKSNVSAWTVYKHLDEIAKKSGRSREELLKTPHKEHVCSDKIDKPARKMDVSEWAHHMNETTELFLKNNESVRKIIEEAEKEMDKNEVLEH